MGQWVPPQVLGITLVTVRVDITPCMQQALDLVRLVTFCPIQLFEYNLASCDPHILLHALMMHLLPFLHSLSRATEEGLNKRVTN